MGNTCKPMAVSFQCMTKSTTNKKKKEKKKINEVKNNWFFDKINKINEHLIKLTTKEGERSEIINIRNKEGHHYISWKLRG